MNVAPEDVAAPHTVPAIEVRDLGLQIGGATIVKDVSFQIATGEFVGLIGPNGAGKTTLINLLSGTVRATSGHILLHGVDVSRWPAHRRAVKASVGRSFQSSNLFGGLTVLENVRLAVRRNHGLAGTLRMVRREEPTVVEARSHLRRVGLGAVEEFEIDQLSHGQRRKVELAILLAMHPSIVLLDEPMAGVSSDDVPDLVRVIREVHAETRATFLMVEHHMHVVTELCRRLAVMHHGELIALDVLGAVQKNPTVKAAYMGDSL